MKKYDLCIIGGGAAGLIAAASLDKRINICLLEKNEILGRKIMATGGGRCNITNLSCANKDLTLDFFKSIGLETYCDDEGRYFPYSNQASDVVKILVNTMKQKNIHVITSAQVTAIEVRDGMFWITYGKSGSVCSKNVLLTTGGKAAPYLGTTGDGYSIAKALGHKIEKVYPILSGIECGNFKAIKGVRARGKVSLYRENQLLREETGEIQFTEDGISGICVFNLTPYIKSENGESIREAMKKFIIELDLAPDFAFEQIAKRKDSFGILSEKLAAYVGIDKIKNWKLPVYGVKGWKNAQCTAGGVSLEQINMDTMESTLVPGLYFAGEIIDRQGPCGGYNLQNAWETGMKAAEALNGKLK